MQEAEPTMQSQILAIRLPEDLQCPHPDSKGYCYCAIRTGGDRLYGELGIAALDSEKIVVEMRLQGLALLSSLIALSLRYHAGRIRT